MASWLNLSVTMYQNTPRLVTVSYTAKNRINVIASADVQRAGVTPRPFVWSLRRLTYPTHIVSSVLPMDFVPTWRRIATERKLYSTAVVHLDTGGNPIRVMGGEGEGCICTVCLQNKRLLFARRGSNVRNQA